MENKEINSSPKFTLVPNPQNANMLVLVKEGMPCDCPFRVPVMLPARTSLGQANGAFEVAGFQCSNLCQFFKFSKETVDATKDNSYNVTLKCSGQDVVFNAELEEQKVKANVLKGTRFE